MIMIQGGLREAVCFYVGKTFLNVRTTKSANFQLIVF